MGFWKREEAEDMARCPACRSADHTSRQFHNDEFDRLSSEVGSLELDLMVLPVTGGTQDERKLRFIKIESLGELREELAIQKRFADPEHVSKNSLPMPPPS